MAGHDPYCYWDASFPSRSFDVYGQYVNNYYGHWDFPGPGLQFPGHLISFLLGWSRGLTSPVCSKSCTAQDVEIQSNPSEREFHCNTTLQRRSGEYADLHPGSADIAIVLVFTNLN